MNIDEKRNPNSWSELPLDLLNIVFGQLGFVDFQRAKSVCSSWDSASRQSVPKRNQIHWLILFPKENNNNSCCTLFNPEEKDNKLYKTKDIGFEEFAKSVCIATYGSWLLMIRDYHYLYMVNLFTKELINLPSLEKVEGSIICPVFWIDEKTKDYVVLFGRHERLARLDVVYSSSKTKNKLSWNQIPDTSNCMNLVYLHHKLYFLSSKGILKIFDFPSSGEIPKEIFHCGVCLERLGIGRAQLKPSNRLCFVATQLVVNVTGEIVFKVEKFVRSISRTWSFRVSKFYSSGFLKRKEVVDSLGDEAMLLDQGITVLAAAANEGLLRRNSIYFSDHNHQDIFVFNLETQKTELLHKFDFSSVQFSRARWFLPSFTHI